MVIAERGNTKYDNCQLDSRRDLFGRRRSLNSRFPRSRRSKHLSDSSTSLLPVYGLAQRHNGARPQSDRFIYFQ